MRPLRRLIIGLLCICAASGQGFAIEPDDLPWEDLNARPSQAVDPDDPTDPIGDLIKQSNANSNESGQSATGDVDADRLEALKPLLEPSPHLAVPVQTPAPSAVTPPPAKTAMKPQPPVPPAVTPPAANVPSATAPAATTGNATAAAPPRGQLQPAQAAPIPTTAPPMVTTTAPPASAAIPSTAPAAIQSAVPAPPVVTTAPAPTPPVVAIPATPAPAPTVSPVQQPAPVARPPLQTAAPASPAAVPPPSSNTSAPAQAAQTPAAAPATATVSTDGKLFLPLRRYFDTRAAVVLKDFDEQDRAALVQFYDARMGEALWVNKTGFNAAAASMIEEFKSANDWGLSAEDFKVPGLTRIGEGEFSDDDLSEAEIKLSLTAMEYARHARGDRIDSPTEQLSSYIDRKPQMVERPKLLEALTTAADKGLYLRSLHPKHPQFERLRQKLIALRKSGGEDEFEKIPDGPKITQGKSHWQVALVRNRLKIAAPGMKPDGTAADENFYDAALAEGVIRFKEKNEITPANATITADLRKALNVDNRGDELRLLANMEQWRWMPEDLGATHIEVNIPEFTVRVVKNGGIIHEERIVTGRVETQTPIFSDFMRTIVFQPAWNVPESIKMNELLPKLRAGGNPIASQGLVIQRNGRDIDVWDVDWQRQDIRNYYIFQPPGDANVLGIVKFLFPNKHSVYLHDTPSKRLFNEKVRTFSHGCMRVRNPVRLAEVIMAEDKGWGTDEINELITTGPENNDIALEHPMPVHVMYFTNWVTDAGELKTFADVYGHEQRIKLGLEGRWGEIVKNRDHLLPPEDVPVAGNRDDWGDADGYAAPRRRQRSQRYSYRDDLPPRGQYAPAPQKKHIKGVGDLINQVLGGF